MYSRSNSILQTAIFSLSPKKQTHIMMLSRSCQNMFFSLERENFYSFSHFPLSFHLQPSTSEPNDDSSEFDITTMMKTSSKVMKAEPSHFELLKVLGQGSFGKVRTFMSWECHWILWFSEQLGGLAQRYYF